MLHCSPDGFLKYFLIFIPTILPFIGSAQNDTPKSSAKYTIVFDPGHGGKDIGTSGSILIEKDVTFSLAEEIAREIVSVHPEIKVLFTREDDDFIPIHQRVAFANANNADLFVSVHCNGVKSTNPNGIETYVLGTQDHSENLETVKRENASILQEEDFKSNYGGFDPESPSGHIYFSAIQNKYLNESILMAHEVQTQFDDMAVLRNRGVKQAGFVVLRKATMPALLLEIGYLSNVKDEKKLMDNSFRQTIVKRIADGMLTFIKPILKQSTESESVATTAPSKAMEPSPDKTISPKPKSQSKTSYTVLIASSAKDKLSHLHDTTVLDHRVIEKLKRGIFEYTIGMFENLSEALALQNAVREQGYKGAYVKKEVIQLVSERTPSDIQLKFVGVN